MATRDSPIEIPVGDRRLPGTLIAPATVIPGFLFVQGWGSGQEQYLMRARTIAALGCLCLIFEPCGVAQGDAEHETVTREDNLRDLVAAYDTLASQQSVDRAAIGVVGSSYGAYLAAVLTAMRPVQWLALRAPALYKDEDWGLPKHGLDRETLAAYRRTPLSPGENRALKACAGFEGDVLVIESEHDDIVPHQAVANYVAAFEQTHSLTYRVINSADHALSDKAWQQAYTARLVDWVTEMVFGAREDGSILMASTRRL